MIAYEFLSRMGPVAQHDVMPVCRLDCSELQEAEAVGYCAIEAHGVVSAGLIGLRLAADININLIEGHDMHPRFFASICSGIFMVSIAASCATSAASAKTTSEAALRDFIDAASYRLSLADQVALTKWDSRKPVEDAPREKIVIDAAVMKASEKGESAQRVTGVFSDQIEANKFVQYRLLALWERAAAAPTTPRPNLVLDIRPKLDVLQSRLIDDLAQTRELSTRPDCARQVALAVGDYVSEKNVDALHALALDRATARLCER